MTFAILGLDHVVLRIRDRGRMLHFYCDLLGCTLERELEDLGLIQLRAGASIIDLLPIDKPLGQARQGEPLPQHANLEHFCLRIEPFDEAALRRHFQAHGMAFEPAECVTVPMASACRCISPTRKAILLN